MEYYDPEESFQVEQLLQEMREDMMVKVAEMLTKATGDAALAEQAAESMQRAFEHLKNTYENYVNEFDPAEKLIKFQKYKRESKIISGIVNKLIQCLSPKRK